MLQETKLDDSFPNAQFNIDGYVMHRLDHKSNSGGIIAYVRSDIPQKKVDLYVIGSMNKGRIELQAIEITVNNEKWLVINIYKEPKTPDATLVDHLDKMLSTYCSQYTNVVLCGDINVNMLKNNSISDIVDVHGMKNIVTKPTCFKSETPTLIDVVFTTVPKRFKHVCCIESDLSDFHQMVCFSTKFNAPRHINKVITYRSYKNFNREQFLCDLASAPFHAAQVFDTVDDAYWVSESLLLDVVNKHAPLKKRVIKQRQIPYMNSTLRKQNNVRDRFKRIWLKNKSMKNREAYVRHRNLSTKLRKQSLNINVQLIIHITIKNFGRLQSLLCLTKVPLLILIFL